MEQSRYKRSNSCSDIIYDVISDDEEVATNSISSVKERSSDSLSGPDIIYDDVSHEDSVEYTPYSIFEKESLNLGNSPPVLLPKLRPIIPVPRIMYLSELEKDKLPIVIEVVEGICDEDDKKSIYTEDKLVVLSRANTTFVTCVNMKEQMFNIPIIPNYHIAIMSSNTNLDSKRNETVKSILEMKEFPNQIIANNNIEFEGLSVMEGQILEVSEKLERNAKYLRVQTLSGEELELPKSLKHTFSCSINSDCTPLPLAIELCVFPQRVVLIDKTCKGRTRKMLCTILDSYTDTFFKVCEYKGDLQSSFRPQDAIFQIPIDIGITFKIIERLTTGLSPFHKPAPEQRLKSVSRVLEPVKLPPLKATKPHRSMSFSNLGSKVITPKEIEKPLRLGSFRINKSNEYERKSITPPPVKNKPTKGQKGKFDKKSMIHELRNISLEKVTNFEDTGPSVATATKEIKNNKTPKEMKDNKTPKEMKDNKTTKEMKDNKTTKGKSNQELAEENKQLKETITSLDVSLSRKERLIIELEVKLNLLENALAEANSALAMEIKRNKHIELRERSLPAVPDLGQGSTPTSPMAPSAQFPLKTPPVMTAKPRLYSKQKDNTEQQEGIDEEKHTMHYMGTVLDRINLSQYKDTFFEYGINTEIFQELDEEVFENELGVKAVLHRKKLLRLAVRMKNNEDISHFFVDPQYSRVQSKNN